jgi:hypothetical protein
MKCLFAIICLFFVHFFYCQDLIRKKAVVEDLSFLYAALKENHPAIFKFRTEQALDSLKLVIEQHLPETMPKITAYFELRRFIAFVGDAHMSVLNMPSIKGKSVLSAEFEIKNHLLYLKRHQTDSTYNGSKVLFINKVPSEKIIKDYASVVSSDAYNFSFKEEVFLLIIGSVLKNFHGFKDSVKLSVEKLDGSQGEIILSYDSANLLKPLAGEKVNTIFKQSKRLQLFKDADSNTVLKLTKFQNRKYKSFYKKIFTYLASNAIDTLFIDLRNNTGGNFYHAYHLMNYIANDTLNLTFSRRMHQNVRYFRPFQKGLRLLGIFHREVSNGGIIKKENGYKYSTNRFAPISKNHFKGKVVILTNGLSMSSSTMVVYYLKHKANAMIIGEAGGGEFGNCGGAFPKLKLPNTKLKLNLPIYWLNYELK